jgi:hypothetical protein
MKGKQVSKIAMIVAAVIIISYNVGYLLLSRAIPTVEEQKSIILLGISILIIFTPIYLSIILDKITSIFKKDGDE